MAAPDDTDKKFEAIKTESMALVERVIAGQTLGPREQFYVGSATAAHTLAALMTFTKGTEEAERIQNSKALKDRFKKFMAGGIVFPQINDPKVIRAARAEALQGFEKAMAAYDARAALLAEEERLQTQHKALTAEQAQRLAALEKECQAIDDKIAAGTAQPFNVGKPLNLGKPLKLP